MPQARPGDPGRPTAPTPGQHTSPGGRPGAMLTGRYRLDEPRPGGVLGAERWAATDQILARPVTVTLVTGERQGAALDAARRAALVVDPRLIRILDVGTADGAGYIVTEAVEGRSLSALAARAPLTADQARAVVGELAAALEAARRRGVHHLALRPDALVLTPGGRVVLEGLAVDGELLGVASGGAHAKSRADTVGLVRVLYAALTGRWPAATDTAEADATEPALDGWSPAGSTVRPAVGSAGVEPGLPLAPEHQGAPLPPTDLAPGVPADLDTLCVVTLGPNDDGPHSPGELVRELEPWRAVRADEIFRAADAGRWHSLDDQAANQTTDTPPRTGTTTAPPTGSSPMSDDHDRTTPAPGGGGPADDATSPAGGPPRGGTGAAGAAGIVGAAGGAAAAAAGAGSAAGATSAVARQSVRSAFSSGEGPGTRRPGTPPPAIPAAASFQPASPGTVPVRTSTRANPGATTAAAPGGGRVTGASGAVPTASGPATSSDATGSSTGRPGSTTDTADTAGASTASDGGGTPAGSTTGARTSTGTSQDDAGAEGTGDPTGSTDAGTEAASGAARTSDPTGSSAANGTTNGTGATSAAGGATTTPGSTVDDVTTPGPDGTEAMPPSIPPATPQRTSSAGAAQATTSPTEAPAVTAPDAPSTSPEPEQPTVAMASAGLADADPGIASGTGAPAPAATAPVRRSSVVDPGAQPARFGTVPAESVTDSGVEALGSGGSGTGGPSRPEWDLPFPAEQPATSLGQRRFDPSRWVLGLVGIGVVVGLIVALGNVLSPFRSPDEDAVAAPAPTASAPATPPAEEPEGDGSDEEPAPAVPPAIAAVHTIDPSDDDGEHEELVGRLTDGDPATAWYTHTYNRPDFAGFKNAVGLVVTLEAPATVTAITLDVNGSGGNVEVRSTDAANPTAGDVLAGGPLAPQTVLTLSQPTETQSIVLWFTELAQTPDGANRIEISSLAVS